MNFFSYKNPMLWTTIFLLVLLIFCYLNQQGYFLKGEKIVSYKLPTSTSPDTFGPKYWGAIHNLVGNVPCPSCREKGKSLFIFAHDVVNHKLQKPIFDKENFTHWQEYICKVDVDKQNG